MSFRGEGGREGREERAPRSRRLQQVRSSSLIIRTALRSPEHRWPLLHGCDGFGDEKASVKLDKWGESRIFRIDTLFFNHMRPYTKNILLASTPQKFVVV